jgi:hypothetical protein
LSSKKLENQLQTITDEVGFGPIGVYAPPDFDEDVRADERKPISQTDGNITSEMDGKQRKIEISYRPDKPPPTTTLANALDNGRQPQPLNDNRPSRYHIREMAQRGELGINEPENRRHSFDAGRLKRDIAMSTGEFLSDSAASDWRELALPHLDLDETIVSFARDTGLTLNDDGEFQDTDVPNDCATVDNAEGEYEQIRTLHARQVISLAEDVLGDDYKVLTSLILDNWTARTIGENEGYMNRATASACGIGMIRSALRNLSRFYLKLDRLEHGGERPPDVWPLIGTPKSIATPVLPGPFRWRGNSYWNQARGPVIQVPERMAA